MQFHVRACPNKPSSALGDQQLGTRFIVSWDDDIYEALPDVSLTPSGRLVCVFAECTHHRDRGYTRVMCDHLR
jgi:hypothetical protein